MKNKNIVFLHSPRSGGTTLNSILRYQYGIDSIHSFHNGFTSDSIESYLDLSEVDKNRIKCFRGHIIFGLHQYCPRDCIYITILRHPIKRVLSLFGYISGFRGISLQKPKAQTNLENFLTEGHKGYIPNDQVRRIAGINRDKRLNLYELKTAQENIENHFAVVAITERFDESILLTKKVLNWKKEPWFIKNNRQGSGDMFLIIPSYLIEKIRNQNELDIELYNYARCRLQEQLKQQNVSDRELKRFNFVNRNIVTQCAPPVLSLFRQWRKQ